MKRFAIVLGLITGIFLAGAAVAAGDKMGESGMAEPMDKGMAQGQYETAIFAGGCFWCMQPPFDKTKGVIKTVAGYTGGTVPHPTYEQVSAGGTGHAESVEVTFDPKIVSYKELLDVFWHNIDPLAKDRQFCDGGHQYRSAIFYVNEEQKKLAQESKAALESSKRFTSPIETEIVAATAFYPAEEYHQEYYRKNPARYKFYRWNCGRDQRLKMLWGDAAPHADE